MAKQTSEKIISFDIEKKRKITIERRTFNMGKRRELFWIQYHSITGKEYRLPSLSIEELEKIVEEAKKLRD